jgi:hypothetical protein
MAAKKQNPANILLEKHLRELHMGFEREYRFHSERKWRFDYRLTQDQTPHVRGPIAIEIEGGIFSGGRHTRGVGFQRDLDKYNHATLMGWRVLRFSTRDVLTGRAKDMLKQYLGGGR